ncbi:ATP-binding protein [Robbsia sp. KACC 23696]|uniref:AAA family ATPase n=1 Tax=Robbsia sp. KACC 23696 TaxID=3149231 RepID=UPI00325A6687
MADQQRNTQSGAGSGGSFGANRAHAAALPQHGGGDADSRSRDVAGEASGITSPERITSLLRFIEPLDLLLQQAVHRVDATPDDKLGLRTLVLPPDVVDRQLGQLIGSPFWARQGSVESAVSRDAGCGAAMSAADVALLDVASPLGQLVSRFGLDALQVNLLLLSAMPLIDRRYAALFSFAQQDKPNLEWPTLDLAFTLLGIEGESRILARAALGPDAPIFAQQLVVGSSPKTAAWAVELRCDPAVFAFLIGGGSTWQDPAAQWLDPARYAYDPVFHGALVERMSVAMRAADARGQSSPILVFRGDTHEDACAAWVEAADRAARKVLALDCELLPDGDLDLVRLIKQCCREGAMRGAWLWVRNADLLEARKPGNWHYVAQGLEHYLGPLALSLSASDGLVWLGQRSHRLEKLPEANVAETAGMLARTIAAEIEGDPISADACVSLAARFRLSPQTARPAVREALLYQACEGGEMPLTAEALRHAFALRSQRHFGKLAQRIVPRLGLSDVMLSADVRQRVNELLAAVRQREVALERGFAQKVGRATGIAAMFHGGSGTGKTLTAEALAHHLGVDLVKVDLSTVVNKFIGETEKNLSRIFDLASADAGVLFFDEADALFGKRSETKDAHDRHANIEVSYLLQRMESFPGLIVMSTNHPDHLDEAFSRRIAFMIEFKHPDRDTRRRLWSSAWPEGVALAADLSFDELADISDLAGGNIKNVALLSAWMSMEAGAAAVSRDAVFTAIAREFEKLGRLWFR